MNSIKYWFYWLATLLILGYLFLLGKIIIFPLILSLILAVMFSPGIKRLERIVKFKPLAFVLFYIMVAGILGLGFYMFGDQVSRLFTEIDSSNYSWNRFQDRLEQILRTIGIWDGEWRDTIVNRLNSVATDLSSFLGSMLASGTNILLGLVLTLVFAFFITMNYQSVKNLLMSELEKPRRKKLRVLTNELPIMLRSYFRGLGIVMIVLAIANSILFWMVGLDYPYVWGILIGALSIIPYVGTMIGLLLPLSYSFLSAPSLTQPLLILLGFGIIQQIEGNILTPKIVGEHVNLNAFTALISTIIAGLYWGVAGAVIAIPAAGVIKLLLEQWEETQIIAKLMSSKIDKSEHTEPSKIEPQKK